MCIRYCSRELWPVQESQVAAPTKVKSFAANHIFDPRTRNSTRLAPPVVRLLRAQETLRTGERRTRLSIQILHRSEQGDPANKRHHNAFQPPDAAEHCS